MPARSTSPILVIGHTNSELSCCAHNLPDNRPVKLEEMPAIAPDPLALLLEEHLLAALLGQMRLEAQLGEEFDWSLDGTANRVTVGPFGDAIDVVGTERPGEDGGFVWAWADNGLPDAQVASSVALQAIGARRGVAELVTEQLPPGTLDADLIGLLASGVTGADGYFVGEVEDLHVVLLLRDDRLRTQPLPPGALNAALDVLASSELPLDHRRAVRSFLARAPQDVDGEIGTSGARVRLPGGQVVLVAFDPERGRIARHSVADAGAQDAFPGSEEPFALGAPLDAEDDAGGEHVVTLGTIDVADGRLLVCDPLLVAGPGQVQPLPGALPRGEHTVELALVPDPAGGERVQTAYVFVGDGAPVEWEPAGTVLVDSGVLAFATPDAVDRLGAGGDEALAALEQALAASAAPTWEHASADGLHAFSPGFGDGELEVFWGYDEDETLVCVAVDCLPEWQVAEQRAHGGSPGRGMQRGYLIAALLGTARTPENAVPVDPPTNRALAAVERRIVRGLLAGHELEVTVEPEHATEDERDTVPVRVRFSVAGGPDPFSAAVDVSRAGR